MSSLFKFIDDKDDKAWKCVITGWIHPIETHNGEIRDMFAANWTNDEDKAATCNNKVLYAIFICVDTNQFRFDFYMSNNK